MCKKQETTPPGYNPPDGLSSNGTANIGGEWRWAVGGGCGCCACNRCPVRCTRQYPPNWYPAYPNDYPWYTVTC